VKSWRQLTLVQIEVIDERTDNIDIPELIK